MLTLICSADIYKQYFSYTILIYGPLYVAVYKTGSQYIVSASE